jgi:hypothetical protein
MTSYADLIREARSATPPWEESAVMALLAEMAAALDDAASEERARILAFIDSRAALPIDKEHVVALKLVAAMIRRNARRAVPEPNVVRPEEKQS